MKLFVEETGSSEMVRLVEAAKDGATSISTLAIVEVRSAIRRRERTGEISPAHASSAIAALTGEARRSIEHELTVAVTARSATVIDRHALRALDALQLATALIASENLPQQETTTFVCSDVRLLHAAETEGLLTWNPETS